MRCRRQWTSHRRLVIGFIITTTGVDKGFFISQAHELLQRLFVTHCQKVVKKLRLDCFDQFCHFDQCGHVSQCIMSVLMSNLI